MERLQQEVEILREVLRRKAAEENQIPRTHALVKVGRTQIQPLDGE